MIILLETWTRNMQKWERDNKKVQVTSSITHGGELLRFRDEDKEFDFAVSLGQLKAALRAFDWKGTVATEGGES